GGARVRGGAGAARGAWGAAGVAGGRAVFVKAVDVPPTASAYLGGVVRRDGVAIAISRSGDAPALAGLLREGIDALLPDDLDRWSAAARDVRREWKANGTPMAERRPRLLEALNAVYAEPGLTTRPEATEV